MLALPGVGRVLCTAADNACLAGMMHLLCRSIRDRAVPCLALFTALLFALLIWAPVGLRASQPGIQIISGDQTTTLSRDALLQRADLTEVRIQRDPTYKRSMSYRALPLARLLHDLPVKPGEVIEVSASDGFVTPIPSDLLFAKDGSASVAYLAIEREDEPWPVIPGKTVSAGPFYVVWIKPEASGVRSEQWPYAVVSFHSAESPLRRWPVLAVDTALPADSPIRAGQSLFITQCMVCHSINGAGNVDVGPDLNIPQNPTDYLTAPALHQLIRNPASVRHWPEMKMQGFEPDALSDQEIDRIIAYLAHMARRKAASAPAE